jgi:hypothetical protein
MLLLHFAINVEREHSTFRPPILLDVNDVSVVEKVQIVRISLARSLRLVEKGATLNKFKGILLLALWFLCVSFASAAPGHRILYRSPSPLFFAYKRYSS